MRLICVCPNCGADDDWAETETKGIYYCQYCRRESSKIDMKFENELYGVMEKDMREQKDVIIKSEEINCDTCKYNNVNKINGNLSCFDRWLEMTKGLNNYNCWEHK